MDPQQKPPQQPQQQQQLSVQEYMQRLKMKRKLLRDRLSSILRSKERSVIKDILRNMSENDTITDEAEILIMDYIESAILYTTQTACRIAKSRKSSTLDKKDIDFAIQLQMVHRKKKYSNQTPNQNAEIAPYYSQEMEEIFSSVKNPSQEHLDNLALLEKFRQQKKEQNNK